MRTLLDIVFKVSGATAVVLLAVTASFGQDMASFQKQLDDKVAARTISGAQLGMVMCEDASGNMVACSGNLEETTLGIVTSVPYVTLNKPASKDASKFIFNSFVSAEAGVVEKGDYLLAGPNGSFILTKDTNLAYAMALDNVDSGQKTIRVKLLSKK